MEYLDREGGKYLATKLKSYVDNKVTDLPSGTVDLTNYYTKEETDQLLANLPSGGTGTKGDKGDTGVGISSIKSVNYELIITLTDGTVHNLGNIRGEKGAQGEKGADGINGTNGTDGVSPTVSVTETTNGHTVAITDVNGTQSFNVLNGKDGKDGASGGSSSGGSSGGASNVYSTEETAIGTWIDGSTIYRKVIEVGKLASVSSGNYDTVTTTFSDVKCGELLRMTGIIKYGTTTRIVVDGGFSNIQMSPSTTHSTYINDVEKSRLTLIGSSTSVNLWYGANFGGYNYTLVVEYTKL